MSEIKKLVKIQEALNHLQAAAVLIEESKQVSEDSKSTVIHVKLGSGDKIHGHQFEKNLEDAQVEAKAEELYNLYKSVYSSNFTNMEYLNFKETTHENKEGFRAVARHLAIPQTDVQEALHAALKSERELMGVLREIGQVFGKNVGVDIGILELPELVESQMRTKREIARQRNELLISSLGYIDHHLDFDGLCSRVEDLRDESKRGMEFRHQVVHLLKKQYGKNFVDVKDDAALIQLLGKLELPKRCDELEAHLESSKQIMRLNTWLQGHKLGEPGIRINNWLEEHKICKHAESVTDTVIKLLDESVRPHAELEAHRDNTKNVLRLNNWLQEHKLGEPGASVTDTVIKLLDESVKSQPKIQMKSDCGFSYEDAIKDGWTEVQLVDNGYARWLPQPQSFQSRVMDAIHINPGLRAGMTENRLIEILETLLRDESVKPAGVVTLRLSPADVEGLGFECIGDPKQLIKTLINRTTRLAELEESYEQLAERVAEAYTYCPLKLK